MKCWRICTLLLTTALVISCAARVTPSPLQTPPIVKIELPPIFRGFSLLLPSQETYVGSIRKFDGGLIGSAVLISPTWALTAGHCADDDAYWFETNGKRYCIEKLVKHPKADLKNPINGDVVDLALIQLSEPCEEAYLPISNWKPVKGEWLSAIGFGGGLKKISNPGILWYYGTLIDEPYNLKMLCYDGTIWFGDSGGAILNSKKELVGIMSSFGARGKRIYENSAIHVCLFVGWINETMGVENEPQTNPKSISWDKFIPSRNLTR